MLNYVKKNTFVTDRKVSDRYYHNYYENLIKENIQKFKGTRKATLKY